MFGMGVVGKVNRLRALIWLWFNVKCFWGW